MLLLNLFTSWKLQNENKVEIGPYARVRPGTILKEGSKWKFCRN